MRFPIHQIGDVCPEGVKKAVEMLNMVQTIWKLEWTTEIKKPTSYDAMENLAVIPHGMAGKSFVIGITAGMVEGEHKVSLVESSALKALISEYEWRELRSYDPPEVFWALALANVCFKAGISGGCDQENCLGFKEYTIDNLLLKLLNLQICIDCETKILTSHKYQLPEIRRLIDTLRRPMEYENINPSPPQDLPVLKRQIRRLQNQGNVSIFRKFGIIILMHFLEDLIPFVEGLIKLGAREDSISLIVKPYPYSQRSIVHSYFYKKHRGLHISYLDKLPPNYHLLKELIEDCRSRSSSGKLLVIEDGGYIVPFLHRAYSKKDNFCIGAVEQTTRGLRRDEKIINFQFPVLDVAKSDFKDEYESPLVGRAVVSSIQKLLSNEHFSGEKALVVGFGAVGEQVASALRNIGMIVKVYDSKLSRVVAAHVRGFEIAESPSQLVQGVKLIIGTTGENSIKRDILEHMENGTILVSASSDLVEIDINQLKIMSEPPIYEEGVGTRYIRKKGLSTDEFLLLGDGYPINFYSGSGIPNKSIDPILAQLFTGATFIAKNSKKLDPGIHHIMNEVIREYRLLEDFLDTRN